VDICGDISEKGLTGVTSPCNVRHMTEGERPTAQQVREALEQTGGRVQEAAALLGINRVQLWRLRRAYGIDLRTVVDHKEAA
jgi:transcriptional regulator of acetoin/glycerol metabolism